jgi:hypothetical protein
MFISRENPQNTEKNLVSVSLRPPRVSFEIASIEHVVVLNTGQLKKKVTLPHVYNAVTSEPKLRDVEQLL